MSHMDWKEHLYTLWREVYAASIRVGDGSAEAQYKANVAVRHFKETFE